MEARTPQAQDLTFVSTMNMVEELKKRHDALTITGVKFVSFAQGNYKVLRIHHGHRFVCLAQLANLMHTLNEIENKSLMKDND